jgi:tetratricopeptide (TPR) repeat protein
LLEQTLADRERVLGRDHPATLTSRNNLAYAYQPAGRLGEAIPLLEQTLADAERVLGGDHPDTLTSRNNLAYAYQSAGRLGEAIPLLEQTLADYERVLGGDHPATLGSRNNLACAYQSAGRLGEAIPLLEQTLADYERVLGRDHPDTLTSRNNLAYARLVASQPGPTRASDAGLPSWWVPVVAAAAAVARGHADPVVATALQTVLDQQATSEDWAALVTVLRRIVAGHHGAELLAGLDAVDTAIARDLLDRLDDHG